MAPQSSVGVSFGQMTKGVLDACDELRLTSAAQTLLLIEGLVQLQSAMRTLLAGAEPSSWGGPYLMAHLRRMTWWTIVALGDQAACLAIKGIHLGRYLILQDNFSSFELLNVIS